MDFTVFNVFFYLFHLHIVFFYLCTSLFSDIILISKFSAQRLYKTNYIYQRRQNMGVVEQIKDTIEKITKDESLMDDFKKDPINAVEKVIGKDLPDDAVEKIIDGVKAKMTADKAGDLLGSIKKLF